MGMNNRSSTQGGPWIRHRNPGRVVWTRNTLCNAFSSQGRCGTGVAMEEYDLIIIGSGSAMNFVDVLIRENPKIKIAVIDKDEPGGICLTRGCIPSKIMVYPAELVRTMEETDALGIEVVIGGGYIAAEFGHFFSAAGSEVTII